MFIKNSFRTTKLVVRLPLITADDPVLLFIGNTFSMDPRKITPKAKLYIGGTDVSSVIFGRTSIPNLYVNTIRDVLRMNVRDQIATLKSIWLERHFTPNEWCRDTSGSAALERINLSLKPVTKDNKALDHRINFPTNKSAPSYQEVPPPQQYHPLLPAIERNWNVISDELRSQKNMSTRYNPLYRHLKLSTSGIPTGEKLRPFLEEQLADIASVMPFKNLDNRAPTELFYEYEAQQKGSKPACLDVQPLTEELCALVQNTMTKLFAKLEEMINYNFSVVSSENERLVKQLTKSLVNALE